MIECLICHCTYYNLGPHLRTHGISAAEYCKRFSADTLVVDSVRNRQSAAMKGHKCSEESRRRNSETQKGRTKSYEAIEKVSAGLQGNQNALGHTMSKESIKRMSESLTRTYASDPSIMMRASKNKSETMKRLWKDPEYAKHMTANWNRHPNASEVRLSEILDKHFPGEWRCTASGEVAIGGHLPDFVNVDGKKEVIEMFGLHWHDPIQHPERLTEERLVAHYATYGFKCLVLWEDVVWCDEDLVVERVKELFRKEVKNVPLNR